MKVVRVKIVCKDADEYRRLITGLCRIYMSHFAKYDAPASFVVECRCPVIHAERNLDQLLEELQLTPQSVKTAETFYETPPIRPYVPPTQLEKAA